MAFLADQRRVQRYRMQAMVFPKEVEYVGAPVLMTKLAELQRERVFRGEILGDLIERKDAAFEYI